MRLEFSGGKSNRNEATGATGHCSEPIGQLRIFIFVLKAVMEAP